MIHFLPDSFDHSTPYDEAVARLNGIRAALGVAEQVAGLSPSGAVDYQAPAAWPEARRRCLDTRSVELAQGAAAGLEMLAAQRDAGAEAHPKSVERLALTLRTELAGLDRLFSL
ncbi:MAG: hypothetical protein ABIO85_02990 [Sphingomicrobium sp.]